MRRPLLLRALLPALLAVSGSGCLNYNDECQAFVDNPQETIGNLDEEVYLDKPNVRHANNAIGQLAADAFLHAQDGTAAPAIFGVINGGNIRADGVCITRNTLLPGPLRRGVLHEALPFDNIVLALDLKRSELRQMMEQSVSGLSRAGEPITNPPGNFLNISSGGQMDVDCSKPGGKDCVTGVGCRVTRLMVGGRDVLTGSPDEKFRVSLTRFVVSFGADVLVGLDQDASRNPVTAQPQGGIDSRLAEQYLREHYDRRKGQPGLRVDPTRINLTNCATPPRPAG